MSAKRPCAVTIPASPAPRISSNSRSLSGLKVIGIGNAFRSDDAAGLIVAQALRETLARSSLSVAVHEASGDVSGLFELFENASEVWIIDAIQSGQKPGTLTTIDCSSSAVGDHSLGSSSHAVGIGHALELARALGKLPPCVRIFGIEGGSFSMGRDLSPEVQNTTHRLTHQLLERIKEISHA